MHKIGVIIPTMNLYERYTKPCIESVIKSISEVPIEVFVIDQNSSDNTVEKTTDDFRDSAIRVTAYANPQNIGCAAGWNMGIDKAKLNNCTHFLIINNDILISPNAIQNMYNRLQDEATCLVAGLDISGECAIPEAVLDVTAGINRKEYSESPHPHFSCFMISEGTLETVGWFDEGFYPAYFEDNDYHRRIKVICGENAGVTITTAAFYHFGSRTQNEALGIGNPVVPGVQFKENEARFARIWGGLPNREAWRQPYNDPTNTAKLNRDQTYQKVS